MLDLAQLKAMDALLRKNDYDDETFARMLPFVANYLDSLPTLRQLPLGEAKSALVMLAGGKR